MQHIWKRAGGGTCHGKRDAMDLPKPQCPFLLFHCYSSLIHAHTHTTMLCGGAVCPKINTHPKLECGEFDAMEKGRRFCGNKWQIKPKHMWMWWWLGGKCKPNISVLGLLDIKFTHVSKRGVMLFHTYMSLISLISDAWKKVLPETSTASKTVRNTNIAEKTWLEIKCSEPQVCAHQVPRVQNKHILHHPFSLWIKAMWTFS